MTGWDRVSLCVKTEGYWERTLDSCSKAPEGWRTPGRFAILEADSNARRSRRGGRVWRPSAALLESKYLYLNSE